MNQSHAGVSRVHNNALCAASGECITLVELWSWMVLCNVAYAYLDNQVLYHYRIRGIVCGKILKTDFKT